MPHAGRPVKADVLVDDAVHEVTVRLAGHFEPIDGRYRWSGRISAHDGVTALLRAGRRDILLRCTGGEAVPARLAEVDPWGGILVTGLGRPPLPLDD